MAGPVAVRVAEENVFPNKLIVSLVLVEISTASRKRKVHCGVASNLRARRNLPHASKGLTRWHVAPRHSRASRSVRGARQQRAQISHHAGHFIHRRESLQQRRGTNAAEKLLLKFRRRLLRACRQRVQKSVTPLVSACGSTAAAIICNWCVAQGRGLNPWRWAGTFALPVWSGHWLRPP